MNTVTARLQLMVLSLLIVSTAVAQVPESGHPLRIGVDQNGGSRLQGEIATVRLYGRPLSAAEIATLFRVGRDAAPPAADLIWRAGDAATVTARLPFTEKGATIEAWVKPAPGTAGRIADSITPGGSDGFLLDTYPGNALRLIVGAQQVTVPVAFTGQWLHVAATVDEAGDLALYVDGVRRAGHGDEVGVTFSGTVAAPSLPLTAWYGRPARSWTEALPIGNGRLGGMVWGGVAQERIDLNEDTLWSGEPFDNVNPQGLAALPEIRRLLREGHNDEAQSLVESKLNGRFNQCYLPLGWLTVDQGLKGEVSGYRRELDLQQGVVRTEFHHDGALYTREVFASHPHQAIVLRFACDRPGRISCKAGLDSLLHHVLAARGGSLRMIGRAPAYADAYGAEHRVVYQDGRGMAWEARLLARAEGGRLAVQDDGIVVEACNAVTFYLVAATSYNGPHHSPSREGRNPGALCDGYEKALSGRGRRAPAYATIRRAHVADHSALFGRVGLDLGQGPNASLPTPVRLRRYTPQSDPGLAALYYQFGRYLLIAGSRPGTQPCNLQGIWSKELTPAWAANWTLNCNAEINYWPVETGNLAECHLPLIDLTDELSVDGAHVAAKLYGARGWVAHHNTDIWRQAAPVAGSACWSIFQVGGAWLCQHVWEHYAFTQDRAYLRRQWPVLREAARYYLSGGLMQEPQHGWLVTGPDTNFENAFRKPDGTTGCTCMGPTGSMQMVRDLFRHAIEASRVLGVDAPLRAQMEAALPRLAPMQISPTTGELQEWLEDWQRTAPCQVLSSWGAICSDQITPRATPDLAAALRRIFDRGGWWRQGAVGSWQGAFQGNVYARLGDGDTALAILSKHLTGAVQPDLMASFPGYTEFQIDGNLGQTAVIAEMLLQSQVRDGEGYIMELLPALPTAWAQGSVHGLRARGGFVMDIAWRAGKPEHATIHSLSGRRVTLRTAVPVREVRDDRGHALKMQQADGLVRFASKAGGRYEVSF